MKRALVLGHGGVGRAVYVALSDNGYDVTVVVREPNRVPSDINVKKFGDKLSDGRFDLIVNCLPFFVKPEEVNWKDILDQYSDKHTIVYDTNYVKEYG